MTGPALPPKVDLAGVGVTIGEPEAIVQSLQARISARSRPVTVAAVNVHTFTEAQRDPAYRRSINDADVAFVDGEPIRWLLRLKAGVAPTRIHGADLTLLLLSRLAGARHMFFGSTPETLDLLQSGLRQRFPSLCIADVCSPPFRKKAVVESPQMLERINGSGADVLWVALGAPKQEHWARINRDRIHVPVVACVGAAFEILAGKASRAPKWLQRRGLEWSWRLAQDPGRLWRRYLSTNGYFAGMLARSAFARLWGAPRPQ